jgi:hypothetical protein
MVGGQPGALLSVENRPILYQGATSLKQASVDQVPEKSMSVDTWSWSIFKWMMGEDKIGLRFKFLTLRWSSIFGVASASLLVSHFIYRIYISTLT